MRNPADYASGGFSNSETRKSWHCFNGSAFLDQEESEWPKKPDQIPDLPEDDHELKRKKVQVHMSIQEDSLQALLLRYSSLYKLLMTVAWLLRCKKER